MASAPDNDTVLIAYDGSDHAKEAIAQAGTQLRGGRQAVVLTIWNPVEAMPFAGVGTMTMVPDVDEEMQGQAEKTAREGSELAKQAGFEASARVERTADASWARIVEVAEELEAGVVVMGSHGRTGLGRVLLGSVATAVAHHVKRPVFISSKR